MRIQTENVQYCYKGNRHTVYAVDSVTQEFLPGRFYAIIGKSGSGKSTLLSLLAGLRIPTSGKVLFDGVSTAEMDCIKLRREHVAVIYQDFNLFPLLTVEENVIYPMHLQKASSDKAMERAHECLSALGLKPEQFDRFPKTLSGGEQQRVAIARALAAGSELLLADEPTGNLDSENSENIVKILKRLAHEENRCVIVVTHDESVADEADTVLRMRDGKMTEAKTN